MAALLKGCGISLSSAQLEQLWAYHQLLRQHNPELNLTRIHNFDNMVLKLYVDSILPGLMVSLPSPLLDLGTGPGMPGVPLKIAFPELEILLAESRRKRVEFLRMAVGHLALTEVRVIGESITPRFEEPIAGVITRAVEDMSTTLDRVRGCLDAGGLVIFMKGPQCDGELQEAIGRFSDRYRLVDDRAYRIPHTEHERRLVVFQRLDTPERVARGEAMKRYAVRPIQSEQNEAFKDLKKLLTGRGVKKAGEALICGSKQVQEALRDFPAVCKAWITRGAQQPPPPELPEGAVWIQLAPPLFEALDLFGTDHPLLLVRVEEIPVWDPSQGLPEGCSVLVPFQDPENVGAVIRSAVAFGAIRIILLAESAHPYHPKALRASGGAVLRARLLRGPALADLPEDLPLIALSSEGTDLRTFSFPTSFGLLAGLEGPGLPQVWRRRAVAIPMAPGLESLNAATAAAVALYEWSRRRLDAGPSPI